MLPDRTRLLAADFFRGAQVALLLQGRDPPQRCLLALCALDKLTYSHKVRRPDYPVTKVTERCPMLQSACAGDELEWDPGTA